MTFIWWVLIFTLFQIKFTRETRSSSFIEQGRNSRWCCVSRRRFHRSYLKTNRFWSWMKLLFVNALKGGDRLFLDWLIKWWITPKTITETHGKDSCKERIESITTISHETYFSSWQQPVNSVAVHQPLATWLNGLFSKLNYRYWWLN